MNENDDQKTESKLDFSNLNIGSVQSIFDDMRESDFGDLEHQSENSLDGYEVGTIKYYYAKFRVWTKPKPLFLRILVWFTAIIIACAAVAAFIALFALAVYVIAGIAAMIILFLIAGSKK